jgi:hypothetical protein
MLQRLPPWLRSGLNLDERIELVMPKIMGVVRPPEDDEPDRYEGVVIGMLRMIGSKEQPFSWRPSVERKSYLDAAAKFREGLTTANPHFWTMRLDDAETIERVASDMEAVARKIPNRRGGGSDQSRIIWDRKRMSAGFAYMILDFAGHRPTTTDTGDWVYLATIIFQAAMGRQGNLVRAVRDHHRQVSGRSASVSRGRPSAGGPAAPSSRRRR